MIAIVMYVGSATTDLLPFFRPYNCIPSTVGCVNSSQSTNSNLNLGLRRLNWNDWCGTAGGRWSAMRQERVRIRSSLLARRGHNYIQMIEFFCLWTTLDTPQAGGNRHIRSSPSFDSIQICFFIFQIVYSFWWAVTVRLAKCGHCRRNS